VQAKGRQAIESCAQKGSLDEEDVVAIRSGRCPIVIESVSQEEQAVGTYT
jgi:hypothetical protein